ncbi:unnamed protein product [Adineta steineri]|uniref:NAD(+)--protein-arginine ADP-ribosyltransferase n=2 Tax=Adineta steineri TaxID=433720 RepID=A0A813QRB3_9BILA|nr:unnamed protein product [Adineta steineri]
MSSSADNFADIELENKRLPAFYGYLNYKLLSLGEAMRELQDFLIEINRFVKLAKKAFVHRILNQTLRAEDRTKLRPWFGYLKLLDSATSKLPKLKGTIFRRIDKNITTSFKEGQRVSCWSVTSCSKSIAVISSFINESSSSTLFHIECLNGKSISSYT